MPSNESTPLVTWGPDKIEEEQQGFTLKEIRKTVLLGLGVFLVYKIWDDSVRNIKNNVSQYTVPPFPITKREMDPVAGIVDKSLLSDWEQFHPFPTGAFWTNLVIKDKEKVSFPIVADPYSFKWSNEAGLLLSYPAFRRQVSSQRIMDTFSPDLTISAVEGVKRREVEKFDLLSVTLTFFSNLNSESSFKSYIVEGSPYITASYTKATPSLKALSQFSHVYCLTEDYHKATTKDQRGHLCNESSEANSGVMKLKGRQFLLEQSEGLMWLLFSSSDVTLVYSPDDKSLVTFDNKFSGVLRLAMIPPGTAITDNTVKTLVAHARAYPIGADIFTEFTGSSLTTGGKQDSAEMKIKFETLTMDNSTTDSLQILMLALPHHMENGLKSLSNDAFGGKYFSIKGPMNAVVGSEWLLHEKLTPINFNSGRTIKDVGTKEAIQDALKKDVTYVPPSARNSYGFGKEAARMAQLVNIANEIEDSESQQKGLKLLKDSLVRWFDGSNEDKLFYDSEFGGIITSDSISDTMTDFGNARYNDHHFHYGYFIYAAAVVGKYDKEFLNEFGDGVDSMVYDVANYDSKSPYFPVARHKSWFNGHSWASGLFSQGNGKNQESSSEAINCYYAVYLWSLVRGDVQLKNYSRLLLAMEIRAAKTYWHMIEQSKNYDSVFEKNYMVANVGGLDVTSTTWFGESLVYTFGVNMIPFTAISEEVFSSDYAMASYEKVISPLLDSIEMSWRGFFVCFQAIFDSKAAWQAASDWLISPQLDSGLSLTQVLYWIATRPPDNNNVALVIDTKNSTSPSHSTEATDDEIDAKCASHASCATLGLVGDCCPTPQGVYLGCCG